MVNDDITGDGNNKGEGFELHVKGGGGGSGEGDVVKMKEQGPADEGSAKGA